MKKVLILIAVLLSVMNAGLFYVCFHNDFRAKVWSDRVKASGQMQQYQRDSLKAIEFGHTCLAACRSLATENGLLCERDAKMTKYVAAMEEENARLKAVVAESVDRIEAELEQNNDLHDEISNLKYKIQCLEDALKAVNEKEKPEDWGEILNDIINTVKVARTFASVL